MIFFGIYTFVFMKFRIIINKFVLSQSKFNYYIDDNITINAISDKYEDYLAGVEFTVNIYNQREFDACDAPII